MTDNVDITPTMTSNTTPSPNVVTADTEFDAPNQAWHAFDKNGATGWASASVTTGNIIFDFGSGNSYQVQKYTISPMSGNLERAPKDFSLQGSNDGSTWVTLDTQTNQIGWSTKRTYKFSNSVKYRYFKLVVTSVDGGTLIHIAEIELITLAGGGSFLNAML